LPGELSVIRAPSDHIDLTAAMQGDLDGHMGRRAESVKGQLSARPKIASSQGPITDDARTKQRRCLDVADSSSIKKGAAMNAAP
jgi:hypothetical protein